MAEVFTPWAGIKLLNVTLTPAPTEWSPGIMDLDSKSRRTASGLLFRDRIAVKRKLTLKWGEISQAEAAAICLALKPIFVEVEYDDLEGGRYAGTFYAGDRTAEALEFRDGVLYWKNFTFTLTER